jgi:hypothetical protein
MLETEDVKRAFKAIISSAGDSPQSACQVDIFCHNGDPLGMDCRQLSILTYADLDAIKESIEQNVDVPLLWLKHQVRFRQV